MCGNFFSQESSLESSGILKASVEENKKAKKNVGERERHLERETFRETEREREIQWKSSYFFTRIKADEWSPVIFSAH